MTFINDKIGEWTPAQLQSFIQDVISMQGAQIPTSLNFQASEIASGKIENLDLRTSLNVAQKVGLTVEGVPVSEGLVAQADSNGQLTWSQPQDWLAPANVVGDAWAGQNFDSSIFSTTGSPALNNQRASFQLIQLKRRTTSHDFYVHVAASPAATITNSAFMLMDLNVATGEVGGQVSMVSTSGTTNPFASTGPLNAQVSSPITFIDPGWYYFGVWVNLNTGSMPSLLGATAGGINAVNGGGLSRSCGFNSITGSGSLPSSFNSSTSGFTRFTNIFWVGAGTA